MLGLFGAFRKNQAIHSYLRPLRRALFKRYGKRDHYTRRQVRTTLVAAGLATAYEGYAYAIYCSPEEFRNADDAAGREGSYAEMRAEAARLYNGETGSHVVSGEVPVGGVALDALENGLDFSDGVFGGDGGGWGADGFGGDCGGGGCGGDGGCG